MLPRKEIDISYRQILKSFCWFFLPRKSETEISRLEDLWLGPEKTATFSSVRSGFDRLLSVLSFQAGSEVIMSALTIGDMEQIVIEHGLQPVAVDLNNLFPDPEQIEKLITAKTKMIVVTQLFGTIYDLDEISKLCYEHNILLIEDCAQAYCGPTYMGNQKADVSMFSFGPIKTNTALGGAIFSVYNAEIINPLKNASAAFPTQTRTSYLKTLIKYFFVKILSIPKILDMFVKFVSMFGADYDLLITKLGRRFPKGELLKNIRVKPNQLLLRTLAAQLSGFDEQVIDLRKNLVKQFSIHLEKDLEIVGDSQDSHFWLLALICDEPNLLATYMQENGFDASVNRSLKIVEDSKDAQRSSTLAHNSVFLPLSAKMDESAVRSMAETINCYPDALF